MFKKYLKKYDLELIDFCDLMSDNGLNNNLICKWFNVNHCKFSLIKNQKATMTNNFKMLLTLYVNIINDYGVNDGIKKITEFNSKVKK